MRQLKIGKRNTNDIVLEAVDVSGNHAVVTQLSENVYLIEDNQSTNGTFLNGQRIRRSTFTKKDVVHIATTRLNNNLFFKDVRRSEKKKTPQPKAKKQLQQNEESNDYSIEFQKLEAVYNAYIETKNKIQNNQNWLSTGLKLGLSFIPVVGFGLSMLAGNFLRRPEKLATLNEEFKIHYVCPKCKRFLGHIPYEGLVNMKKHSPPCNALWVRD